MGLIGIPPHHSPPVLRLAACSYSAVRYSCNECFTPSSSSIKTGVARSTAAADGASPLLLAKQLLRRRKYGDVWVLQRLQRCQALERVEAEE